METKINTIIFDLGAVLIDWNPRYMYNNVFQTEEEVEWFLENICTPDWNENQDAGYPLQKATDELESPRRSSALASTDTSAK